MLLLVGILLSTGAQSLFLPKREYLIIRRDKGDALSLWRLPTSLLSSSSPLSVLLERFSGVIPLFVRPSRPWVVSPLSSGIEPRRCDYWLPVTVTTDSMISTYRWDDGSAGSVALPTFLSLISSAVFLSLPAPEAWPHPYDFVAKVPCLEEWDGGWGGSQRVSYDQLHQLATGSNQLFLSYPVASSRSRIPLPLQETNTYFLVVAM